MYNDAEELILKAVQKAKFEELNELKKEYENILVWFEPEFQKRIQNISHVVQAKPKNEPEIQKQSISEDLQLSKISFNSGAKQGWQSDSFKKVLHNEIKEVLKEKSAEEEETPELTDNKLINSIFVKS